MATTEQIAAVRRMAAEPSTEAYTDTALSALVDSEGSPLGAVVVVWEAKAASYAELVDTSESGSSRKMSQLHLNALRMRDYYYDLLHPKVDTTVETASPFTVGIERT